MAEKKKYTLDKETLEAQLDELSDMKEGLKETIAENEAIARDSDHLIDKQGEWAETRNIGLREALDRYQRFSEETEDRLKSLSDESQDEQWQKPASKQDTEAENNVIVFKETKIKNIKITDAKPSANELARFAEVRRKSTISQVTEPFKEEILKGTRLKLLVP